MCLTRFAGFLTLTWMCAGCVAQQPIIDNLEALRVEKGFPGATFAIKQGGQPVQGFAVGLADIEGALPMTTQARMLSGSTGKTFVAALALQLVAEGVLELDKPIDPWFAGASWYPELPHKDQITLRMLLSHTSGIADHVYSAGYAEAVGEQMAAMQQGTDVETYIRPHRLVQYALAEPWHFEPGEGFQYSDTGYILIGLLIEAAGKSSYYDQLQGRLLGPLGLSATAPAVGVSHDNLASGYTAEDNLFGLPKKVASDEQLLFDPATEWTGGGLVTTAVDLCRWAGLFYGEQVLGAGSRPKMLETGQGDYHSSKTGYGLGVYLADTKWGLAVGHEGWFPGYRSMLMYWPDRDLAAAMQVNSDDNHDVQSYLLRVLGGTEED